HHALHVRVPFPAAPRARLRSPRPRLRRRRGADHQGAAGLSLARTDSISDGAVPAIAAPAWTAEREVSAAAIEPRTVALLAVLVAGSILLRVPFLSVPMITDEGGYSYTAKFWSSEYQLYRDIPFDRPQAIFLLYRLAF